MATNYNASACAKNWELSKQCPMTFPTMFQASSVFKSYKWKHSAANGNYSGSGGATAYLGGATAYLVGPVQ